MSVHDFECKLAEGKFGERLLDIYFKRWFKIQDVPMSDQQRGIDRVFLNEESQAVYTVEYKTDAKAYETGNVFIETESISATMKAGWGYTSQAQLLFYFLPQTMTVYIVSMVAVRQHIPGWLDRYPTAPAPNIGYNTTGILVPLPEFVGISMRERRIPQKFVALAAGVRSYPIDNEEAV